MHTGLRALTVGAIAAALATGTMATAAVGAGARAPAPTQVRVAVSVATLWTSPESPRAVDASATAAPADPARWLRGLGTAGRRGLDGRVDSQALYGQPVSVLEVRGAWSRVTLTDQPTPKAVDGYPGWIPSAQLTQSPSAAAPGGDAPTTPWEAVVIRRTAWAHDNQSLTSRAIRLSYGTRLPVQRSTARAISVVGPDGRTLWVSATRVKVVRPGSAARTPKGSAVVAEARKFLGLPYLWGGTSGFGLDCSGLTHLVYAQLGVTIPRDATPQFATGRRVATLRGLRKGDLVFFRNRSGSIHHVGIYAGRGRMIHSPRTGRPVQLSPITSGTWGREFAGGRRYL